jgi:hypothetical protein
MKPQQELPWTLEGAKKEEKVLVRKLVVAVLSGNHCIQSIYERTFCVATRLSKICQLQIGI